MQKLSNQKPCWDQARLTSLVCILGECLWGGSVAVAVSVSPASKIFQQTPEICPSNFVNIYNITKTLAIMLKNQNYLNCLYVYIISKSSQIPQKTQNTSILKVTSISKRIPIFELSNISIKITKKSKFCQIHILFIFNFFCNVLSSI